MVAREFEPNPFSSFDPESALRTGQLYQELHKMGLVDGDNYYGNGDLAELVHAGQRRVEVFLNRLAEWARLNGRDDLLK